MALILENANIFDGHSREILPDRHIVWGLTYKFLEILLFIANHPLPDRWGDVPPERRPPKLRNSAD